MHKETTVAEPSETYIDTLHSLIEKEMQLIDECLLHNLQSQVPLINQVYHYITQKKGKRLRPALLILVAKHFSYSGQQHIPLASIIELIHTATLLHDDVVDASLLRRGQETVNQRWGNEASVLIGDFLYSKAFQLTGEINSSRIMSILAETSNILAEGELQQLLHRSDPTTTEADYLNVIKNKTAKLFSASARLGAVLAKRNATEEEHIAEYGMQLGIAFQLIDDVLDYNADRTLGKNIGDDLAAGRPTLPILYAMWHSDTKEQEIIRRAITDHNRDAINTVQNIINKTGAIEYTIALAQKTAEYASASLAHFDNSQYLEVMYNMAQYAITRKF